MLKWSLSLNEDVANDKGIHLYCHVDFFFLKKKRKKRKKLKQTIGISKLINKIEANLNPNLSSTHFFQIFLNDMIKYSYKISN